MPDELQLSTEEWLDAEESSAEVAKERRAHKALVQKAQQQGLDPQQVADRASDILAEQADQTNLD